MAAANVSVVEDRWILHRASLAPPYTVLASIICLLILTANCTNLYIFKRFRNIELQHQYMIGLTMADMFTLVPNIMCITLQIARNVWLTQRICEVMGVITILPFEITVGIQIAMSVDKCIFILHPMEYRLFALNHTRARAITRAVMAVAVILPIILDVILIWSAVIEFYFDPVIATCYVRWQWISIIALSPFTVLPMIIQGVSHSLIIRELVLLKKRNGKRLIRASATIMITVLLFYIAWFPHAVYTFWVILPVSSPPPRMFMYWSAQLLAANSCVSTFIYAYTIRQYKDLLTKALGIKIHVEPKSECEAKTQSEQL